MKSPLLIVEDDLLLCQAIQNHMQSENIDVCVANSIADALDSVLKLEYCLLILSIQAVETGNMELLRMIRSSQKMPIIVLADKMTADDKIVLFRTGVTACVEKPVNIAVFIAQASSLIHLYLEAKGENRAYLPLIFGSELIIDTTYRQVVVDGEPLDLTCKEFELLVCLAKHPCQVWSRAQLYRYVWNDTLGLSGDSTIKTHIGNLKKKLVDKGKDYIQNSRGVGYRFVPPTDDINEP